MTFKNAKKSVGLSISGIVLVTLMFSTSVAAEPKFDETITKAAADQVAKKLGDLRGGFAISDQPEFVKVRSTGNQRVRRVISLSARNTKRYNVATNNYAQYAPENVRIVYSGTVLQN